MDPLFIKGLAAVIVSVIVLIGSVWLLLAMILGARLGYFVTAVSFFGIMLLLSVIWLITALGPKGPETTWDPVALSSDLSSIESDFGDFDVADYPAGDWAAPGPNHRLADLKKGQSTEEEVENAKPVMDAFVSNAVSEIPGKREEVHDRVQGTVALVPGEFQLVDFRMKEATVDGKESLIAVAKAVPSALVAAGELGGGLTEGVVEEFLAKPGDTVSKGQPLLKVSGEGGTTEVVSDKDGKLIHYGLRIEDKIKAGVPFATLDISGQPGAPQPAEVAAVRVRGSVRMPSVYYLIGSLLLFALHMVGLRSMERSKDAAIATA